MKTDEPKRISTPLNTANWQEIVSCKVAGIRYGVVQITIHDGEVTQIESTEKTRLAHRSLAVRAPR